jgi:hypothetical protein
MRKTALVATAVAAAMGGAVAQGAQITVFLQDTVREFPQGQLTAEDGGSTATWSYDTVTGVVTGTGSYEALYRIGGPTGFQTLFTHQIEDLSIGGASVASGTSFGCIEGTFGPLVGASTCGNYNFGANFLNESTISYGPGTAFSRTIGGDDIALGVPENLGLYGGMISSFDGTTLTVSNSIPLTSGQTMTFVTPIPAAAWLFGSALGALGWARRRRQ